MDENLYYKIGSEVLYHEHLGLDSDTHFDLDEAITAARESAAYKLDNKKPDGGEGPQAELVPSFDAKHKTSDPER